MAYIFDWINKEENAAVTSHTVNMPVHQPETAEERVVQE